MLNFQVVGNSLSVARKDRQRHQELLEYQAEEEAHGRALSCPISNSPLNPNRSAPTRQLLPAATATSSQFPQSISHSTTNVTTISVAFLFPLTGSPVTLDPRDQLRESSCAILSSKRRGKHHLWLVRNKLQFRRSISLK